MEPLPEKHRILVVDDDASSAKALAQLLQEEGYAAIAATSSASAIGAMADCTYQLLLVEPSLGDRTGPGLLRYADERGVPRIVITSDPDFDPARGHLARGGFLYKPVHFATLLRLITAALDGPGRA